MWNQKQAVSWERVHKDPPHFLEFCDCEISVSVRSFSFYFASCFSCSAVYFGISSTNIFLPCLALVCILKSPAQREVTFTTVPLQVPETNEKAERRKTVSSQHCECNYQGHSTFLLYFSELTSLTMIIVITVVYCTYTPHVIQAPNPPYQNYWSSRVPIKEYSTLLLK